MGRNVLMLLFGFLCLQLQGVAEVSPQALPEMQQLSRPVAKVLQPVAAVQLFLQQEDAKNSSAEVRPIRDYRGTYRWVCENPNCPEGCAEIVKELGGVAALRALQTEPRPLK